LREKKNISIIIEVLRYITVNRKHENEQKYNPSANIFLKKMWSTKTKLALIKTKKYGFSRLVF
jgi:hypothetical protein